MIDAENEGYKIGKRKPTECDTDTFFALGNNQLSYLNSIGRICFQCNGGECNFDSIYYLVDYNSDDDDMHIWVRRDESMCDDYIDDILYDYDNSSIEPKFDLHY